MNLKTQRFINEYDYNQFGPFIERLGWRNDSIYNEVYTVWHKSEDETDENEVVLPVVSSVKNIDRILIEALNNLSYFYKKTLNDIIDQFDSEFNDRLKFQIKSEMTRDGIIPLTEGIRLIESSKELALPGFLWIQI